MPLNKDLVLASALVIALVALGGNLYAIYNSSNEINQNNITLTNQITAMQSSLSGLESNVASLKAQLTQSQGTVTTQAQQLDSVQTSIQGLQTQLSTLFSDLNSNVTDSRAFQAMAASELRVFNSSLAALTQELNAIVPSVPLSTLVIVSDTYDSTTATFNFTVKNSLNVVVYAQMSAVLYGQGAYPCDGSAGELISQIYQFPPNSTLAAYLPLSQANYNGCGASPISSVMLKFQSSESFQVSEVYTFDVIPPYSFA